MESFCKFWVFLTFMVIAVSEIYAQEVCVQKGPCKCEFYNGTGFDLSLAVKDDFYSTVYVEEKGSAEQFVISTYFYHPCIDVLPKVNSTTNNTCTVPLALCRHEKTLQLNNVSKTYVLDNGHYDYMGTSNVTQFTSDGQAIIYTNGPSQTTVMLGCTPNDEDELHVVSLADPKKLVLKFFSRHACLTQIEEPGRSAGSTLCIIFFSLVILYLVLGIYTKKCLMGATGVEVIPNLAFWTDLPNLVKDGWLFALSGFKLPARAAAATPDPNSYDSI